MIRADSELGKESGHGKDGAEDEPQLRCGLHPATTEKAFLVTSWKADAGSPAVPPPDLSPP